MKKLIQLLVLASFVTAFALQALAQTPATSATPATTQDPAETKRLDYEQFTKNVPRKDNPGNPAAAYEAGKNYLAKYEATDGPNDQYVAYIKKWVNSYEKIARREQLLKQLKDKQYNEAFQGANQVLTDFPDDLVVLFELARGGFTAATSGNETNNANTITYTRRALALIQSGKNFGPEPIKNRDELLGNLHYALGVLQKKSAPTEAIASFVNAAQIEGQAKRDPLTYYSLAELYESAEYSKLANQFSTSCKTEEQLASQECKDLTKKVNQVVDHIVDALARAIAYSNASPEAAKFAQARAAWTESLTNYYKYRNNGSDTGVKELIAGIMSRPLPKPGEPVTPPLFPETAPAATPAQPGSTTGAATPGTTTTAPKAPAATSTRTTPRRAHN